MRLFTALPVTGSNLEIMNTGIEFLRGVDGIKIVKKKNIHLTLRFIGDFEEKYIEDLKSDIDSALKNFNKFKIFPNRVNFLPNSNNPRVISINLKNIPDELFSIRQAIDLECEKYGIKKENRSYNPHITLARIKKKIDRDFLEEFEEYVNKRGNNFTEESIDKILLISSELTGSGPIYTTIHKFCL